MITFTQTIGAFTRADPGFPVGGAPTLGGTPTYDFAKFFKKLHEIEKILGRRGAPPLNPPLVTNVHLNPIGFV